MAPLLNLLFLFLLPITHSLTLTLTLTKHPQTGHYLTHLNHTRPITLLFDLSAPLTWHHCGPHTPTPLPCRSILCSSLLSHLPCPSTSSPCTLILRNPLTGSHSPGHLVDHPFTSPFLSACSPSSLLHGLPRGVRGVLGLAGQGQSQTHAQRFNLCLSGGVGVGVLTLGGFSGVPEIVSKSLVYTPLLAGTDYAVNMKSIKIGGNKIEWGGVSKMKISTTSPFSKLNGGVYDDFVRGFVMEAESLNMTRVANVGPFEACYEVGGEVPVVDLVLQSEMVRWRIYENNLMVKVDEDVMCLGFLNGGLDLDATVVLGGYQLEDNLLEFDLSRSMLGFSSSLIEKQQMSCSRLGELAKFNGVQSL